MKPSSRYAVSGAIGGALVELDIRTLYLKDLSFFGCTVLEPGVFQNLVRCIEEDKVNKMYKRGFNLSIYFFMIQIFKTHLTIWTIINYCFGIFG